MNKYFNNINHEVKISVLIFNLLAITFSSYAQADKKYIRQGNKNYDKDKFAESEVLYRKAMDNNKETPDAIFNIGDALYKQEKFEDAGKQFVENINRNDDKEKKSAGLYNLGNSLLMENKVKESIEAYKGSLKMNPESLEAKYNLGYAQDLLRQQEQEQQKQQQNQDNKDQDKKDEDQEQKPGEDEQNDQQGQEKKDQQQQQQQQTISKEDAQRILEALANDEKDVQEKVKLAKAIKSKSRTVKNW
jgi:tetratricopeptide (TPR) repeat protein